MRNVPAITQREINSVFFSPLAYVVLTVFLFFTGILFFLILDDTTQASMSRFFWNMYALFLMATPLLTMRLVSEELRSGTIESLMTAPVTDADVILGKYLGALAFFVFMLLPTLGYVAILTVLGEPDPGPIISAYVGLVLMGCNFIAIGTFCSTLSQNQVVAGVFALVILIIISLLGTAGEYMSGTFGAFAPILEYIGFQQHLRSLTLGRIAFRDCFYFISTACLWLFLAVRVLESRRWR